MAEITVEEELRVVGMKRENLRKAMEKVNSEASGLLTCSIQWNELEYTLKSVERNVERKLREVESKEMELAKLVEAAEAKIGELETKAEWLRFEIKEGDIRLAFLKDRTHYSEHDLMMAQMGVRQNKTILKEKTEELGLVKAELARQHKLLEAQDKELKRVTEEKTSAMLDLDLAQGVLNSLHNDMKAKGKELEEIEKEIEERNQHCDSIKSLIDEHNQELASKEKKQNEMTYKLSDENKTLERCKICIQKLSEKLRAKEDKLESTRTHLKSRKKKLRLVKEILKIQEQELDSSRSLTQEEEKKHQELDQSNQEMIRQLEVKRDEISSLNNELEAKREERDQIQHSLKELDSLRSLTQEEEKKRQDLDHSNQEMIKQLEVKGDEICSLNNELEAKKAERDQIQESLKELDALSESLQRKEKELDEKNQLLKTTQERLAIYKSMLSADGNDGLMDPVGSASLSREEVRYGLQAFKDPKRYVLDFVEEAIRGAAQRHEFGLADPIVKVLAPFLEEMTLNDTKTIDPRLQVDAKRLVYQWRKMKGSVYMSKLEAWCFLHLIAAYDLLDLANEDKNIIKFASYVAHFNQAPRLFHCLGLSSAVPDLVCQLLFKQEYIPAIRFINFFKVKTSYTAVELLKKEITKLRLSANEERQAEERDAEKMREIIQVIQDMKLAIDLPVDLIVKFMVPRGIQTQNQCLASSSSVPVQQVEAGGSTAQTPNQAGFKRPRVEFPGGI